MPVSSYWQGSPPTAPGRAGRPAKPLPLAGRGARCEWRNIGTWRCHLAIDMFNRQRAYCGYNVLSRLAASITCSDVPFWRQIRQLIENVPHNLWRIGFRQYKVYADIRGGSLERGRQMRVRGRRKWRFSLLLLTDCILRTFTYFIPHKPSGARDPVHWIAWIHGFCSVWATSLAWVQLIFTLTRPEHSRPSHNANDYDKK